MASSSTASATIAAALTVALVLVLAEGQTDCISKLVPCAEYLNSTKPSAECCDGMKEVVSTQLDCLCGLLKNPAALGGINITQALQLPKYCNIPSDTSACNALAPKASSNLPPAAPGGNARGNGNGNGNSGAGGRISWMAMPALLAALALTFFY